ncbi:ATP-binding protein, partial [Pseudorhodobacter sp.]|uniref:ATP-binding protein n=1 Tax=Pseudorhodobacter sp. TaxID=1934400 RepID=UPI0026479548
RDILRSMGRAGKSDLHLQRAPLGAVLREAAEPHLGRGKEVIFDLREARGADSAQPVILRKPEVIHGLRNLIQNAVDFAKTTVWVDAEWDEDQLLLRVVDDGDGYPTHILGRIGDPFVSRRGGIRPSHPRPGYEGMGLGLFIAKTLLERSGAELSFANGTDPFLTSAERPARCGAIVEVIWRKADIVVSDQGSLGANTPIEA